MKREYKEMQDFIDDVHGELSIKEVLIDMGILSKNDFRGEFINCLFHDEDNTPSLQVSEHFWKCYGCNLKGDLFAFLMNYWNTDFVDAVKKLADFLNINIAGIKWKFDGKTNKLKEEWEGYLKAMDEAPQDIQKLKRDYFPEEVGYDPKINYLVLALTSKTGAILGFTKRRIGDEDKTLNGYNRPKWKHSSLQDSLIGQCHNMYNLHYASPEIRKKKKVIICEGPKDVIAYKRINKNYVVCVCGTSNSNNIWDLIFPVKNIILSMDLDAAGIDATIKTLIHLAPIFDIKNVESVILPKGQDPYDVVTNDGDSALNDFYERRIPAVEFLIKNGELNDVKDLYEATAEYNKVYVMKTICKIKGFSITEAESWLFNTKNTDVKITKSYSDEKMSEKEQLLAIVNCEDVDVPLIPIEKAKRILALKYGIKL